MDVVSCTSKEWCIQCYLVNNEMCAPSVHLVEHTFKHMVTKTEHILPAFFLIKVRQVMKYFP